jgi:DNA-binding Lrp family transcriptional regulator
MPAPPEESEPAIVSAIGVVIALPAGFEAVASEPCPVLARRVIASKLLNAILNPEKRLPETTAMVPFFVQFKCKLGQSYAVANALAEAEIASEIYSTAGDYDLLVKFYVDNDTDIGHFINEKVQVIPGIQDTHTIITF